MERKEAIRGAYRMTGGNSFYDGMITCSTLSGKAVCRLVWAMNKAENDAYLEKAMSGIPEHFSGKLLEVPVGTGILTMPVYQTMPEADITCLDYSADMMGQAQEKANRLNLNNVIFQQGDVGALPYPELRLYAIHPGWMKTPQGYAGATKDCTPQQEPLDTAEKLLTLAETKKYPYLYGDFEGNPMPW